MAFLCVERNVLLLFVLFFFVYWGLLLVLLNSICRQHTPAAHAEHVDVICSATSVGWIVNHFIKDL